MRRAGTTSPDAWQERVRARNRQWQAERAAVLDPDTPLDLSALEVDSDVVPDTGAVLKASGRVLAFDDRGRLIDDHPPPN